MYLQTFEVSGNGTFPFDMLRYDHCYPSDTDSAQELDNKSERRTIRLSRLTNIKNYPPTELRWKSFGWTVTNVRNLGKA